MTKRYYEGELEYLRELGQEFAQSYPEIASELGLDARDPDVERLLQGVAFLTARLREEQDAAYPELLSTLLQQLWPHALRPTPATGILEFHPTSGVLTEPQAIPRGTLVASEPLDETMCQFRTLRDLVVLPLTLANLHLSAPGPGIQVLELQLQALPKANLGGLAMHPLRFQLHGSPRQVAALYDGFYRGCQKIELELRSGDATLEVRGLDPAVLVPPGFALEEALLPYSRTAVAAYRHLHEFFIAPSRYQGLVLPPQGWLRNHPEADTLVIRFLLVADELPGISKSCLRLHCVPVANLFEHTAEPIKLMPGRSEYLLSLDPHRREHYELFAITSVSAFDVESGGEREFPALNSYLAPRTQAGTRSIVYQLLMRLTKEDGSASRGTATGRRARYHPFLALVGQDGEPVELETVLTVRTLATNGELVRRVQPSHLRMPTAELHPGLTFAGLGPLTPPAPAPPGSDLLWRLVAHLSLGWNALHDLEAFRTLLQLFHYPALSDDRARQSLEQLQRSFFSLALEADEALLGTPPALMLGSHLRLEVLERHFNHPGEVLLLGHVLHHFMAELAPLNTFVSITLHAQDTQRTLRFGPRIGMGGLL